MVKSFNFDVILHFSHCRCAIYSLLNTSYWYSNFCCSNSHFNSILSVSPTHLLLRKVCEEADGKERVPITFFASEDRNRALLVGPYDFIIFSGQPELSSILSCIHNQEGVAIELFYLLLPSNLCCSIPILILISELQSVSKVQMYLCFLGNFTKTKSSFTCM